MKETASGEETSQELQDTEETRKGRFRKWYLPCAALLVIGISLFLFDRWDNLFPAQSGPEVVNPLVEGELTREWLVEGLQLWLIDKHVERYQLTKSQRDHVIKATGFFAGVIGKTMEIAEAGGGPRVDANLAAISPWVYRLLPKLTDSKEQDGVDALEEVIFSLVPAKHLEQSGSPVVDSRVEGKRTREWLVEGLQLWLIDKHVERYQLTKSQRDHVIKATGFFAGVIGKTMEIAEAGGGPRVDANLA